MPDYRVRFVGDLGNLAQFDRAVRNSLGESARQLEAANQKIAASISPKDFGGKLAADSQSGLFVSNQKSIIDGYNRTFKQTGDIIRRSITGYETEFDKANEKFVVKPIFSDEYLSSFNKVIGNLDAYQAALKQTAGTERQINAARLRQAEQSRDIQNQIFEKQKSIQGLKGRAGLLEQEALIHNPLDPHAAQTYSNTINNLKSQIASLESGALVKLAEHQTQGFPVQGLEVHKGLAYRSAIESEIRQRQEQLQSGTNSLKQPLNEGQIRQLENELRYLQDVLKLAPENLASAKAPLVASLKSYEEGLSQETAHIRDEINFLEKEIARLKNIDAAGATRLQQRVTSLRAANPAYQDLDKAANATPPIDANLQRALQQSKALRNQLLKGGLGGGARYNLDSNSDFAKNLAKQEATVTEFVKNMRTGVTTLKGFATQLDATGKSTGFVEKFTADIDKNGKVITRWGGQLSGAGSILRQTVRDFQKVIEWTIATTVVIGSLGLAISSLKTINELNTALTRFSITAQLSVGEARDVFRDLGQVAIDTATPLVDLVKVADDIALATKSAGDSTDQWKQKIIQLTTAVGIFTNLTGEDTVQGADKLSSAFKQLSLAPADLIGVLNKVTAVAGGQSTAINDIVTALGGVGEAGNAAGLKLNEQIALVQVLGQVTNKSAADTATAFKNLFGSISSPGSEKVLAKFGIQIRDSAGGLRPFLTIYREINKALEAGIIPANRYQDVLRGISGGPRRAPDAAALLGNLPAVETAIQRAAGASNEALIANAKVLDTNQAKIQQLQNTFDIAIFEKFGTAVQNATAGLTDFLTTILNLFNSIDPSTVSLLLTLGAITAAAKLLTVIGGKLGPALVSPFVDFSKTLKFAISDLKTFIAEETLAAAVGSGNIRVNSAGRYINKQGRYASPTDVSTADVLRGTIGGTLRKGLDTLHNAGPIKVGVGAAAAAVGFEALTTALNSTDQAAKQTIGQVLQLAGSVGLMTGVLTPLSVAALAGGTALQILGNDAQETAQSAHDASVATYEAIQRLKAAREDVKTAESAQESAKKQLDAIIKTGKTDAETKALQSQATQTYVTATLALADANKVASDSFDGLLSRVGDLGERYKAFKDISLHSSLQEIDELSQKLAEEILKIQGKGAFESGPIDLTPKNIPVTTPIPNAPTLNPALQFNQDLLQPQNLNKLFDLNQGGGPTGISIPVSEENLALLSTSLQDIISGRAKVDFNQDQIDTLTTAVNKFLAANSTFYEIQAKTASDAAKVQALVSIGALKGDQATNAQNRVNLVDQLAGLYKNAGTAATGPEGPTPGATGTNVGVTQEQVIKLINDIRSGEFKGQGFGDDDLKKIADELVRLKGIFPDLQAAGDLALRQGMAQALIDIGIDTERVNELFGLLPGQLQPTQEQLDAIAEKTEKFSSALDSAVSKFAARNAALQEGENSGQYDKNAAGLAALRKQSESAYQSEVKLINAIKGLSDDALPLFQQELSKVVGFEDAATLSSDQLAGRLIDQAIAAGVSGKGIEQLTAKVANLLKAIDAVARIRATFHIQGAVTMNLKQYIAAMKALRDSTLAAIKGNPFISPGGAGVALKGLEQLNAAIAELEAAQKTISGFSTSYNNTISKGTGSNFGGTGTGSKSGGTTAKKTYDTSLLDLPDEIANASNRSALIQQAIKLAKQLQAKVPGATKDAKNDIVELLKGTQRILEVRGVKDDFLRRALEELAAIEKKRLEFETKADTIRRLRIGSGDFSAIANVPLNTKTGVSLGGPEGPINITLNLNGTVLTPAQLAQFADLVAAALKRQIANG